MIALTMSLLSGLTATTPLRLPPPEVSTPVSISVEYTARSRSAALREALLVVLRFDLDAWFAPGVFGEVPEEERQRRLACAGGARPRGWFGARAEAARRRALACGEVR